MDEEIKNQIRPYMVTGAEQAMQFLRDKEFLNIPNFKIEHYANELVDEQLKNLPLDVLSNMFFDLSMKTKTNKN